MFSLFLNSGLQYLSYELPEGCQKAIERIPAVERLKILGVWSRDTVEGATWLKWRITRREKWENSSEYYELMLAVDTTAGPVKQGFVAGSERHIPNTTFRVGVEIIGKDVRIRLAGEGETGFIVAFDLIPSQFGGKRINVALVLDVGNSRTLGLLVDETGDTLSLKENVFPFVLRGKEDPGREESVFATDLELASSPLSPVKYPFQARFRDEEKEESAGDSKRLAAKLRQLIERLKNPTARPELPLSPASSSDENPKHPVPFSRDISFVRLGDEADLLQGRAEDIDDSSGAHGFTTGMSSPKRYLWDNEPTDCAWFMHGPAGKDSSGKWWRRLADQKVLGYLTDEDTDWPSGDQILGILDETAHGLPPSAIAEMHDIDENTYLHWREVFRNEEKLARRAGRSLLMPTQWPVMGQPPVAPDWARYPRRAAMVWLLLDLFIRAWEQINSPQFRSRVRYSNRRRQISDIVITFPACIPPEEMKRYQLQATKALGIFAREILPEEEENSPPQLHWEWDEARSVHMVFLYAATRAAGLDGDQFFRMFSRENEDGTKQIRLGNLDIGGGTTDIAVIDYAHTANVGVALQPDLIYQDGLRVGGDDVLYALIQDYILPRMAKHVGIPEQRLEGIINGKGKGAWTKSVQESTYWRQRWMRSIWVPLATKIIERLAAGDGDSKSGTGFLCRNVCRDPRALSKLSQAAHLSGKSFTTPPEDCHFKLQVEELNNIIFRTFEQDLRSLCGSVIRYLPDFVIISGRITAVPAVRDLILRYIPLPPQRVVFLHGYPVGDWYPLVFQDVEGQIEDAKSAVAVGATIGLLAMKNKLQFFKVMPMTRKPDPGYFWGSGTRLSSILTPKDLGFTPLSRGNDEHSWSVAGGKMLLLRKRDGADDAPAEPVYEVRLKPGVEEGTKVPEYTFRLVQKNGGILVPNLDAVNGDVKDPVSGARDLMKEDVLYRFMTLDDDRYFLDSGEVKIGGTR